LVIRERLAFGNALTHIPFPCDVKIAQPRQGGKKRTIPAIAAHTRSRPRLGNASLYLSWLFFSTRIWSMSENQVAEGMGILEEALVWFTQRA
jgi:hypothetical protein